MDFIIFIPMIVYIAGYVLKYFSAEREINMDQAVIAALITGGVTVVTYGIVLIKNRHMEKVEHDDIKKKLKVNKEEIGNKKENLSKEHHRLSEDLGKISNKNIEISNDVSNMKESLSDVSKNLSDVNKYVIESRTEKRMAEKSGVDIKQIFAQIEAMTAAISNAEMRAAEMEKKVRQCELQLQERDTEIKGLYQQIGELKNENRNLKEEKQSLYQKLYQYQHPDLDEPDL